MLKQVVIRVTAGLLAVVVTSAAHATPFKDIALPEMIDESVAGIELPTDR